MAEIHIQRRPQWHTPVWLSVLAVVVVVGLVSWILAPRSRPWPGSNIVDTTATSASSPGAVGGAGHMSGTGGMAGAGAQGSTSGAITTPPGQKVGQPGVGEKVTPGPGTPAGPGGSTEGSH